MSSSSSRKGSRYGRGRGGGGWRGRVAGGPSRSSNTLSDEDVLIAFMPHLRGGNEDARRIHEHYQSSNNQQAFVSAARHFLEQQSDQADEKPTPPQPKASPAPAQAPPPQARATGTLASTERRQQSNAKPQNASTVPPNNQSSATRPPPPPPGMMMMNLQERMDHLVVKEDPVVLHYSPTGAPQVAIGTKAAGMATPPSTPVGLPTRTPPPTPVVTAATPSMLSFGAVTPPPAMAPAPPLVSSLSPTSTTVSSPCVTAAAAPPPPGSSGHWVPCAPGLPNAPKGEHSDEEPAVTATPKTPPPKKEYQPKRLWTRLEEQPGKILSNNIAAANGKSFLLRPRQELTAKWMLPLSYLRKRNAEKGIALRQALESLTVGLFRRGCMENGATMSIISKEILSPPGESRADYPYQIDQRSDMVWGTVPFYAPRTPGHVVSRLYWQDDHLYTLATGPTLYVCVSDADVEPTLRFILSNFKSKSKSHSTSLSSLHSLAAVLGQFNPPQFVGRNKNQYNPRWEGAGRAAWGCVCESKKVLEACAAEYMKTKDKHAKLEEEVNQLKNEVEELGEENEEGQEDDEQKLLADKLKEKTHALMGGRASNERRWKDAQMAYASILKSVLTNPASSLLLKRDLLSKLRLEYVLWCQLCESFAPSPFNAASESSSSQSLCVNQRQFPHPITSEHFQMCGQSRAKMQIDVLGFEPNTNTLEQILIPTPKQRSAPPNQRSMDPAAVDTFNNLSSTMCQLYQEVYATSDRIHQERELVRAHTESIVAQCDAFPHGTKVVVFGSAANGFGSPTSDLDMCLQLPPNTLLSDKDDKTGAGAMAMLAEMFEKSGMKNVDAARLTARIPVLMFNCPRPLSNGEDGDESFMECDLSMQNPLACLNTSLLLTYSRINPMTNVVASIIKRWAKSRDINNPSRHTLSSYGYVLMLLHFLTYHRPTGNGLVTSFAHKRGDREKPATLPPLLPNLQWMDPTWPQSRPGTPYKELVIRPKNLIPHPSEPNFAVNTYFYRLTDQAALTNLRRLSKSQDSSVAILLASFFHYYACEFDYKKRIVSLNSTALHGLVEREEKAEFDAWKVHFQGLAIEDPFETFYDVAHVVKGGNFHRLRNELALAYTKIVDAASGNQGNWNKDLGSMTGMDLIDWICEPVSTEKEEG